MAAPADSRDQCWDGKETQGSVFVKKKDLLRRATSNLVPGLLSLHELRTRGARGSVQERALVVSLLVLG